MFDGVGLCGDQDQCPGALRQAATVIKPPNIRGQTGESSLSLDSDTGLLKGKASSALCSLMKSTCGIKRAGNKCDSVQKYTANYNTSASQVMHVGVNPCVNVLAASTEARLYFSALLDVQDSHAACVNDFI